MERHTNTQLPILRSWVRPNSFKSFLHSSFISYAADIRKIVFLPRGEEHKDGRDREYVDHNISVRSIGLNVRVPGISNDLLKTTKDYVSEKISKYGRELDMKNYARLCLEDFNAAEFDEQMKNDAELEYKKAMEWLELVTYGLVPSDVRVLDEAINSDNELKDISIYFIRMAYILSLRSGKTLLHNGG